jgi:membrane dipeptidase
MGCAVYLLSSAGCATSMNRSHKQTLHERILTLDSHVDIPFEFATDSIDPGVRGPYRVDLPKMVEGGLDCAFWIVYVRQTSVRDEAAHQEAHDQAMVKFNAIHRMAEEMYPDQVALAYRADEVEQISASGRRVGVIAIENGSVIGRDLSLIEKYHGLGARYITLAHGGHNDICDSATPRSWDTAAAEHGGVSPFGEQVIAEMNRVGIMVDVSHISKASMLDAVRLSKAPVIASHSGVRALADHARNLDDEQLLSLQRSGGVIQIVAFGGYVKVDAPEKRTARQDLAEQFGLVEGVKASDLDSLARTAYNDGVARIRLRWPPAQVTDFVDHIDYAVELIGIDHVGISSDFDGGGGIEGWQNAGESANITAELLRRGYSESHIEKLWSGNLLRVWRATEQVAAQSQNAPH